jgi:hypothetical protein
METNNILKIPCPTQNPGYHHNATKNYENLSSGSTKIL